MKKFVLDENGKYRRTAEGLREQHDYMLSRYLDRRKRIDAIKLERGCIDCGYRENPAALEFDHIDRTKKLFKISSNTSRSWQSILAEIAKCEVRCANCHAIKTVKYRDNSWLV